MVLIPANLDYTRILQYFTQTHSNLIEKLLIKIPLLLQSLVQPFNCYGEPCSM